LIIQRKFFWLTASFKALANSQHAFCVLGELYLGVYRSSNPEKQIKDFFKKCQVLIADNETANSYALIKSGCLTKVNLSRKTTLIAAIPGNTNKYWLHGISISSKLTD